MKYFLLWLIHLLWRLSSIGLVLCLLAVAGTQLLLTLLPLYKEPITRLLSERLNSSIAIGYLDTQWQGGSPSLIVKNVSVTGENEASPGLLVKTVNLSVNLRDSLIKQTLVFNHLSINGVTSTVRQLDADRWSLAGAETSIAGQHNAQAKYPRIFQWLRYQDTIDIANIAVNMKGIKGRELSLEIPYFSLNNHDGMKHLGARFNLGHGVIEVSGKGLETETGSEGWNGVISVKSLDPVEFCVTGSRCHDQLMAGSVTADISWYYNGGQWQIKGHGAIPSLSYKAENGSKHSLEAQTRFFMKGTEGKSWKLWANDVLLKVDAQTPYRGNWYIAGIADSEYTITVASDCVKFEPLKKLLLDTGVLPNKTKSLLKTLNPRGAVHNLVLKLYPSRKPFDMDLSAQLDNVSVDAWEGAPLAENVSGRLRTRLLQGYFDLDSDQFALGFPRIFNDTWHYSSAKARLYWTIADDTYTLKSDAIRLTGEEGHLTGQLHLNIPLKNQRPLSMGLTVGVKNGNAAVKKYIPVHLDNLSDTLANWLNNSIKSTDIKEGGFIYNGVLEETEEPNDANWGLFFGLGKGVLNYHKDWPTISQLSGDVFVNKERVEVNARKAEMLGARLDNVVATIPLQDDVVVSAAGTVIAKGDSLQRLLTETPINGVMAGTVKKWTMTGTFDSTLQLRIPINRPKSSNVSVKGHLNNVQLGFPEYGLTIDDISGPVSYTTTVGLSGDKLKGLLFNYPVTASISSEMNNNTLAATRIFWQGEADIPSLSHWLKLDTLSLLKGKASYSGNLLIAPENMAATLELETDLKGVAIDLPPPLAKKRDKMQSLNLTYAVTRENSDITLHLQGLGTAFFGLNADHSLKYSTVLLGPAVKPGTANPTKKTGKILITGMLPELDVMPWYTRFKHLPADQQEKGLSTPVQISDLIIKRLLYKGRVLDGVQLALEKDKNTTKLSVNSKSVAGELWIPKKKETPYTLVMDHIVLPLKEVSEGNGKSPLNISPLTIPEADVSIRSFTGGSMDAIPLSFKVRKEPDGITVRDIRSNIANMNVTGSLDWRENKGRQHSYFYGVIKGKTIKALQEALYLPAFIQAKDSEFNGLLNWPGSPLDITFANTSGVLEVKMKDGKLNKLEGEADALKLFGLLNTESLSRRLKLDFSDLYASGLSFDTLKGVLRFNRGLITFDRPIVIEGPSSDFKFDGLVDSNKNALDLSMVITLPVSANLPIFSFLLGASPPVAGIIFLADKLIGNEVDKLASMRYQIKGSFNNPDVELDRLFSNKTVKPSEEKSTPKKQTPKALNPPFNSVHLQIHN